MHRFSVEYIVLPVLVILLSSQPCMANSTLEIPALGIKKKIEIKAVQSEDSIANESTATDGVVNVSDESAYPDSGQVEHPIEETPGSEQVGVQEEQLFECNPIVKVEADNQSRFDLLKQLASEHHFEVSVLESEDSNISMEKTVPLTKAIESITKEMSVVLRYQTIGGCNRIVAVHMLGDDWGIAADNFDSNSQTNNNIGTKRQSFNRNSENGYKGRGFVPSEKLIRRVDESDLEPMEIDDETEQLNQERAQKMREKRGMRNLNKELDNGNQLKNNFNVKAEGDGWKTDIEKNRITIDDMEKYTREVLSGERQAEVRKMSIKQRSEYMKMRRQLRREENQD